MRILYYSSHPALSLQSLSGYGTHMREVIGAFRAMGNEVLPLIMGGTHAEAEPGKAGFPLARKWLKPLVPAYLWSSAKDYRILRYDAYAQGVLKQHAADFQPDLIYERAAYLQHSGVHVAQQLGIRHILEMNSPYVEEHELLNGRSAFLKRAFNVERKQVSMSGKVCVVSSALRDYLIDRHPVPATRFQVIPNAINPAHLKVDADAVKHLRARLGLGKDLILGFVGSIFPWHGVDILIEAFARVQREIQDMRLLIVGSGEILPDLQAKARGLGVEERVIFTGKVPHEEVFNFIAAMDITLLANSHWYGSPVKLFEYGAMGKAIIAPDNVPVRDVMAHETEGLLVSPDAESVGQAIRLLANDVDMREKIALRFQQKVLEKHTWKQVAETILEM